MSSNNYPWLPGRNSCRCNPCELSKCVEIYEPEDYKDPKMYKTPCIFGTKYSVEQRK